MAQLSQEIVRGMQRELDVDLIGVASVDASTSEELRRRATALLPGAKSAVVFAKEIYGEIVSLLEPTKEAGAVEAGQLLGAHQEYINGRLTGAAHRLAALLRQQGYRSLPLPSVSPSDQRFLTGLFSYKHAAELAGLGTIGRHSLLITPEYGPRVRLACVLTEASMEPSPVTSADYCIDCEACIEACPAHAIGLPADGEAYSINKHACRTYLQAGPTCSVCMKVCAEVVG